MLRAINSAAFGIQREVTSIRSALVGGKNDARTALDLVIAYEQGEWASACAGAERLGLRADVLPDVYSDGVRWSRQLSQITAAA